MSVFRLFIDRLKQERKYQWNNTKAVVDWTILFYIILTLLFAAAMIYDMFPGFINLLQGFPYALSLFFVYYLSWTGKIRVYYQEADSYFFVHRKDMLKGLKKYGLWTSALLIFIKAILIGICSYFLLELASPGKLPLREWILFYCFLMTSITLIGKVISLSWEGWRRKGIYFVSFVLLGTFTYFTIMKEQWIISISILLFMSAAGYAIYWKKDSFDLDMGENEKIRQQYVGMIFYASEYVHVPRASNRTRPLFFRKSQRIFEYRNPANALTELFLKYLLRNFRHILSYFQIIAVTLGVMAYLPLWMTYGLFIAFFFFLKEWLNIIYDELVGHPFLDMQKGKKLVQKHYQDLVTRWLYYPALVLVGFALVMNSLFHFLLR